MIPQEYITEMIMDAANGHESHHAATYPEFWEQLKKEVDAIGKAGGVVGIPD